MCRRPEFRLRAFDLLLHDHRRIVTRWSFVRHRATLDVAGSTESRIDDRLAPISFDLIEPLKRDLLCKALVAALDPLKDVPLGVEVRFTILLEGDRTLPELHLEVARCLVNLDLFAAKLIQALRYFVD